MIFKCPLFIDLAYLASSTILMWGALRIQLTSKNKKNTHGNGRGHLQEKSDGFVIDGTPLTLQTWFYYEVSGPLTAWAPSKAPGKNLSYVLR